MGEEDQEDSMQTKHIHNYVGFLVFYVVVFYLKTLRDLHCRLGLLHK